VLTTHSNFKLQTANFKLFFKKLYTNHKNCDKIKEDNYRGGNYPWLIKSVMSAFPAALAQKTAPYPLSPPVTINTLSTPTLAFPAALARTPAPSEHLPRSKKQKQTSIRVAGGRLLLKISN